MHGLLFQINCNDLETKLRKVCSVPFVVGKIVWILNFVVIVVETLLGLMLHTKAVATQDTVFWEEVCQASYQGNGMCRLGSPYPDDMTTVNEEEGDEGWKYNCYINKKVDYYYVPRLEQELRKQIPELDERLVTKDARL